MFTIDHELCIRCGNCVRACPAGIFIQGVGTQTVDGLRGKGHQAAAFYDIRRNAGGFGVL